MQTLTEEEKRILKKISSIGGTNTVKKYGLLQMKKWGQMGGRPKKVKDKPENKD